jgi:hypothetical protein
MAGTFEPSVASDIVPIAHTSRASNATAEMPCTARLSILWAGSAFMVSHCTMKPPITATGKRGNLSRMSEPSALTTARADHSSAIATKIAIATKPNANVVA